MSGLMLRSRDPFGVDHFKGTFDDTFNQLLNTIFSDRNRVSSIFKSKVEFPKTDIYYEGNNTLVFEAALPGYNKEDIKVVLENNVLEILGETKETNTDRKTIVSELRRSAFQRAWTINEEIDTAANPVVTYRDGVLQIKIPLVITIPQSTRKELTID